MWETIICVHLILKFHNLLGEVMLVEIWDHYIKNFAVLCFSLDNRLRALKKLHEADDIYYMGKERSTEEQMRD